MTPSPLLLKAVRESRLEIAQEYTALCSELDLQKKVKQSFKQHPFVWLSGAAGAGLLTTFFGMKRSSVPIAASVASPTKESLTPSGAFSKAGWIAGTFEIGKMLFPILKPVILEFAHKAVQSGLSRKGKP